MSLLRVLQTRGVASVCVYVQAYVWCLAAGRGKKRAFTTHRYIFKENTDRMVDYSFLPKLTANLLFQSQAQFPPSLSQINLFSHFSGGDDDGYLAMLYVSYDR